MHAKLGRAAMGVAFIGLVVAASAHAEYSHELVFHGEDRIVKVESFTEQVFDHDLYNTGDQTDTYTLSITNEYFAGDFMDWFWSLCAGEACVLDSVEVTLGAAESESVSVHIGAMDVPGGSRTTLKVRSHNDPSDVTIQRYMVIHTETGLLLIDDDNDARTDLCVTAAMESTGVAYGVWETFVQELEDGDLDFYDKAVWITGSESASTLTASDQTMLSGRLDEGLSLLVAGENLFDDIGGSTFANDYLGADRAADATSTDVVGVGGDPVGDGLAFSLVGGCGDDQTTHDALSVVGDGIVALDYDGVSENAGIRQNGNDIYRTVSLGFDLSALAIGDVPGQLLSQAIAWFDGTIGVPGVEDLALLLRGSAFPNPLRASGHLLLTVPEGISDDIRIDLYDATGRKITRLFEGYLPEGQHEISLDSRNIHGRALAPGMYFYRVGAGQISSGGKLTVVR